MDVCIRRRYGLDVANDEMSLNVMYLNERKRCSYGTDECAAKALGCVLSECIEGDFSVIVSNLNSYNIEFSEAR